MSPIKIIIILIVLVLIVGVLVLVISGSRPMYTGPVSDHFDGKRFFGEEPNHTFMDMLKWLWEMDTVEWPEWIDNPPQPRPVEYVKDGRLRITYINQATVLIQMDSMNILTDPIWSKRASPFSWVGVKRIRAPGVKISELPRIDLILISHDHFDHLDLRSLKNLVKEDQIPILAGLGIKKLLETKGFTSIIELDWWQEFTPQSGNVKITFVPALHSSGRNIFGENRTLWGGFVIEGASGKVYFAGDTAYGKFLQALKDKFVEFRLTILPIGNYEKRWFMKTQHMNPEDALKAHILLNSRQSVGIHFGTFSEHPEQTIDAHEKDLFTALNKFKVSESEFWILKFGEGRDVSK